MKYKINYLPFIYVFFSIFFISGCQKLVAIDPPTNTITTSQVFSTDEEATSAMAGVYSMMINTQGYPVFAQGGVTILSGASADELQIFSQQNPFYIQFEDNTLQANNANISSLWGQAYSIIYGTNAIIEGLNVSTTVHDSVKHELIGEAEFTRAFCNFYLVNLFGDIPLVTTSNWQKTTLLSRTPVMQVYQTIITDLQDAQKKLPADYSVGKHQRIIPNRWAATALLARVYLYLGRYQDADTEASTIISNSNLYQLTTDPNQVFQINSTEAIWQLQQSKQGFMYNATNEGNTFIPYDSNTAPFALLPDRLLNTFEIGDLRKADWIDSINYMGLGTTYYFPYKYKIGPAQSSPDSAYTEYYMVLRLAEQFLIRAESRAFEGNLKGAITDLNTIRERAHLTDLPNTLNQTQIQTAVAQERRVEFFDEWGHRWLDLKRTGQASVVLSPIKPKWNATALLYPIPYTEITTDPNLTQNTGY